MLRRSTSRSASLCIARRADAARLLLAFVERYLASGDGVVLHPEWPEGLHGHFVCRVPPARALI